LRSSSARDKWQSFKFAETLERTIAHINEPKESATGLVLFWLFIEMKRYAMIAAESAEQV
jgi:hypothetical protein